MKSQLTTCAAEEPTTRSRLDHDEEMQSGDVEVVREWSVQHSSERV
jgi:hypothetical protein